MGDNEGGGLVCGISGLAQGVWCLGQIHMPRNTGRMRHRDSRLLHPPDVLGEVADVRKSGIQGFRGVT